MSNFCENKKYHIIFNCNINFGYTVYTVAAYQYMVSESVAVYSMSKISVVEICLTTFNSKLDICVFEGGALGGFTAFALNLLSRNIACYPGHNPIVFSREAYLGR